MTDEEKGVNNMAEMKAGSPPLGALGNYNCLQGN